MATQTLDADQKEKALDSALQKIKKDHGEGSIRRLGDEPMADVDVIPTGAPNLDMALGVGGIPKNRITEVYGPEGSGKTTLCLHIVANAQKQGGTAAFIDVEHAVDPQYARKIGVDTDDLLLSQPDTGEQALEIAETLIRSGAVDVVVIDSVAALVPRAEIEGEMGDSHMGLQARLMSQAMRKLTGAIGRSGTSLIFTNQIRMKIGVRFGNPETTSGGRALRFYSSVRLDIRRKGAIKDGNEHVGNQTKVKVRKNKVAAPFKEAEFDILYDHGIDRIGILIDLAEEHGIIDRAGAWYSYQDDNIGQGRQNTRQALLDDPDLLAEIETQVAGAVDLPGYETRETEEPIEGDQEEAS